MLRCNSCDCVHLRWVTAKVNNNDRLCPGRDRRFYRGRRHVQRLRIDVDEDRHALAQQNGARACYESERRDDYFVTAFDADSAQGHFERDGAVGARNCVLHLVHLAKTFLELLYLHSISTPLAATDYID